jgi:hypothetical protein
VALAVGAAAAAVALGRERSAADGWLPTSGGTGPRGLAALHDWLEATARFPLRVTRPGDAPPGAVILLAGGSARLSDDEAEGALARARAGGLVIWAAAPGTQPGLERRLEVSWAGGQPEPAAPGASVADGLALSTGPGSLASQMPGARPVGGPPPAPPAVSVPMGRGEVLVLAGPGAAENARVGVADNLDLWVRAAARGPVTFVEGEVDGVASPSRRALWLLAGEALAAAAALAWARGRRLGAVRPPPPAPASRSAADYLASLAVLTAALAPTGRSPPPAWRPPAAPAAPRRRAGGSTTPRRSASSRPARRRRLPRSTAPPGRRAASPRRRSWPSWCGSRQRPRRPSSPGGTTASGETTVDGPAAAA